MCGIVGYIGRKNAQDYLLAGLSRLEYRGYDSAGIVSEGDTPLRSVGKVSNLGKLAAIHPSTSKAGIGHTRWATHGAPSVANAHPHTAGSISLVHNGIIENYRELRAELNGYHLASETDTEVLAALIDRLHNHGASLTEAVVGALRLVTGTYGIAVMSTHEPGVIVTARMGSPLLIGLSKDALYIASDAAALIGHTSQVVYLNDGEIGVCRPGDFQVLDTSLATVPHEVETIESEMEAVQKAGFDHFLIKEIFDQPASLASTLNGRIVDDAYARLGGLNMAEDTLRDIRHVIIVGCGTAHYAGLLASYLSEGLLPGVTFEPVVASEYRYRSFSVPSNSVALVVSQSGETADTLACLRELKARGVPTLGIINAVGSTIAREVDGGIYVHAGPEISVASTKAFTSQVSAMLLFCLVLARLHGADASMVTTYAHELALLPDAVAATIKDHDDDARQAAADFARYDHALFVGRGAAYPVALEAALKLKEISYVHAEGYPLGELKHGPIALIDDRFFEVVVMQKGPLLSKSLAGVAEIRARGGHVLAVTDGDEPVDADIVIRVTSDLTLLSPLLLNVVLQLFAYHSAVLRGHDVDQPRNLAKSVTVE